ncbi:transcription factor bHLH149-like [Pyrus ussuriensis x Pyrus communis]|uniref:Transcription factor bHLH149-like n=1 Tax=Pyrus ussuriensis x Pyrus communis TaxID=2448454 RepID=A0A5N5HXU1_9ROSA|nr:transcription factor bHLH149-like [Pyrus ussuriensis x Pyrus communis]
MRPYEVEVHGVKVTVSVVSGNSRLIDEKILWLKSQLELKFSNISLKAKMLLVCTDNLINNTAVELGYLAAMVLKKPSLQKKGLYELAGEIGVDVKPLTGAFPGTNSEVFTEEEIKNAVHDVHASCLVGNKVLGMV